MKKHRKLLVIDDEVMIRKVLIRFFGKEGYEIIEADSGWSAIEMFRKHRPFDAVLCDIYLGHDDGWKVVDRIQQVQPPTPIIVMSGSLIEGARSVGNYSILYKPFSPKELTKVLEELWGIRAPTTE